MPRWLRITFFAVILLGGLLLFLAAAGGATSAVFERYFPALLIVNVFATLTVFIFVIALIYQLVVRWRARFFGSKMTARLALAVALIAICPCLLIYLISSQFIGRSIDSWFDVRVEHALGSGVALSGEIITREQKQLRTTALRLSASLAKMDSADLASSLEKLRDSSDISGALLLDGQARILHSSYERDSAPTTDIPSAAQLASATRLNGIYQLEGDSQDSSGPLRIRAIVPVKNNPTDEPDSRLYLLLIAPVPTALAANASDLVNGYRDYQELVLARSGLRSIYRVTLTLTMLLAIFSAIAVSLSFAKSMTAPVLQLAKGTKKVAEGDLRPIREFPGNSEINALTQSFNSMISQIAEARRNVENQRAEAERARAYLERILGNLSSGVLVLNDQLEIVTANAGANIILANTQLDPGTPLSKIEPDLCQAILTQIQLSDNDDLRAEIELVRADALSNLTLFLRGSRLELDNGQGWVIVFDDMSAVIDAQRALAWGEVARRLAHEIKNPLTPIRLAAERLEMKLADKLQDKDAVLLHRASTTIVNQVDAMKQMVNDFRDYAKLPSAILCDININDLFEEITVLYKTADTPIKVQLEKKLPMIRGDATQLRQVIHNLIGNSIDAVGLKKGALIQLTTSTMTRGTQNTVVAVRVTIEDNGPGFAPQILSKAFEPYITTKANGTGLGLPMVKKIIEEHHAKISLSNKVDVSGAVCGAQIVIVFPLSASPILSV